MRSLYMIAEPKKTFILSLKLSESGKFIKSDTPPPDPMIFTELICLLILPERVINRFSEVSILLVEEFKLSLIVKTGVILKCLKA